LIDRVFHRLGEDDATFMAAAVSYYATLSLFPLVLGLILILGRFEGMQEGLFDFFERYMPLLVADFLRTTIEQILDASPRLGVAAPTLVVIGLLWAGTGIFGAIDRAISRAWNADAHHFVLRKARDFLMVLGLGLLVTVFMGLNNAVQITIEPRLAGTGLPRDLAVRLLAFMIALAVFLLLYRYMPNTKTSWRSALVGAAVAGMLFQIAKFLFGFYLEDLGRSDLIEERFQHLAFLVLFLMWIYFSALVLIIGAEVSAEYHRVWERDEDAEPEDQDEDRRRKGMLFP
jgi:membrane protein